MIGSTDYFRIHISNLAAFHNLERTLRREHRGQAIWFWLTVDNLVYAPPILLGFLIAFVVVGIPWLIVAGWKQFTHRKPALT